MPVSDDLSSGRGSGWVGGARHGRSIRDMATPHTLSSVLSSHFLGCRDAKRRNLSCRAISAVCTRDFYTHHSQSSQSISIYDREIGAKISVSVSISRFLRHENLLYRSIHHHPSADENVERTPSRIYSTLRCSASASASASKASNYLSAHMYQPRTHRRTLEGW